MSIPSAEEFARTILDASSFMVLNNGKVQFLNYDQVARLISERDEAIRNGADESAYDIAYSHGYNDGYNDAQKEDE